jgi:hypothetical protein
MAERRDVEQAIAACERYWRETGVPRQTAAEMRMELEQHLLQATDDGRTVEDVIGADRGAFAEAWAAEWRQDDPNGGAPPAPRPQAGRWAFWAYLIGGVALVAGPGHHGGPERLARRRIALPGWFRIIRPYEKGLIEFLGRYEKTVDSGLRWVMPFVKRIIKVDMREQVVDVPPQEVITKDNVVVTVDAVIYYEATDPVKLKYNVANFILAVTKLAQTNLRNVVGDLDLDAALTSREVINAKLRQILDDATDKWGVRVVRVEIQRIEPPATSPRPCTGR